MIRRVCYAVLLLILVSASSGCHSTILSTIQPIGSVPPADVYRLGFGPGRTWSIPLAHTVPEVHSAVTTGLRNLGVTGNSDQGDLTGRRLEGFFQNKRFVITFENASPGIIELRLFCGWWGSERVRALFEATAVHLLRRDHRRG